MVIDKCMGCNMPNPPNYHPHLHCVLYCAYHRDPDEILREYGYQRHVVMVDAAPGPDKAYPDELIVRSKAWKRAGGRQQ